MQQGQRQGAQHNQRDPFDRLKKEPLSALKREYIIDKLNYRKVEKDCLISYANNRYSVPSEYVGKEVAVIVLDNVLAAYYQGKQVALHRISYQKRDMVVNPAHYRRLTVKQSFDTENTLFSGPHLPDYSIHSVDLSRYDDAARGGM